RQPARPAARAAPARRLRLLRRRAAAVGALTAHRPADRRCDDGLGAGGRLLLRVCVLPLALLRRGGANRRLPLPGGQTRQSSIALMSASSGWIAQSSTAFPLALRTSSNPMFLPWNRWYARTIRSAPSRSVPNETVARFLPKRRLNAPPSAAEATRSDAGGPVTAWPFASRQARLFSAEYVFAPLPQPAARTTIRTSEKTKRRMRTGRFSHAAMMSSPVRSRR